MLFVVTRLFSTAFADDLFALPTCSRYAPTVNAAHIRNLRSGIVPVLQRGFSTQRTVMPAHAPFEPWQTSVVGLPETFLSSKGADHVAIHRRLRERIRVVVIGHGSGAIAGS